MELEAVYGLRKATKEMQGKGRLDHAEDAVGVEDAEPDGNEKGGGAKGKGGWKKKKKDP